MQDKEFPLQRIYVIRSSVFTTAQRRADAGQGQGSVHGSHPHGLAQYHYLGNRLQQVLWSHFELHQFRRRLERVHNRQVLPSSVQPWSGFANRRPVLQVIARAHSCFFSLASWARIWNNWLEKCGLRKFRIKVRELTFEI